MKKFVFIGCGGIANYHLNNIMQFNDISLAGFCDLVPSRAEGMAAKVNAAKAPTKSTEAKAYTDFIKMYDEIEPDGAFICIPPYRHGEIELESVERGIAMFIEKPLALDLCFAKDIEKRLTAKNLFAACGFQCRYSSINIPAKNYVNNYPVVAIEASRVGGLPKIEWYNRKELCGGQLVEQTIHQVDMLRYLIGEADTVYSVPTRGFITASEAPNYNLDDASTTIITFKSGITATMITGLYALDGASWDSKMTFGSRASRMEYRLASSVAVYGAKVDNSGGAPGVKTPGDKKGLLFNNENNFGVDCDRTFIDAVITGDPSAIRSPYSDALKSVALVLACDESMETGQPVKVKY